MDIAALITWLITALGGFYLLGTWIARGALRAPGSSHLPAPVLFGHFLLAAAGLVVWIVYLAADKKALAWTAFGLLVPVALLGLTMFARWLPTVRSRAAVAPAGAPGAAAPVTEAPERHFPIPVVLAHGVFAVATVILVLITAIKAH
jgi:hypothetical protein